MGEPNDGPAPTAAPKVAPGEFCSVTGTPMKCGFVLAPAVITFAAMPGESIVPGPGPELPAATATITPASAAALTALARTSVGIAPPPRLRLRTSMPSATAASTALAMTLLGVETTVPGKTL